MSAPIHVLNVGGGGVDCCAFAPTEGESRLLKVTSYLRGFFFFFRFRGFGLGFIRHEFSCALKLFAPIFFLQKEHARVDRFAFFSKKYSPSTPHSNNGFCHAAPRGRAT